MTLMLGLITGIIFGYVLFSAGVGNSACLYNSLSLKNLKAIKLMALAIATGIIILFPIAALGKVELGAKTLSVLSLALGGAIFGSGFALAGYCPGTALAALGAGKKDALWLLAGGLTGSFVYALVYAPIKPLLIDPLNFGKVTLPELLGISPLLVGYAFAAILIGAVIWMDKIDKKRTAQDSDACTWADSK